MKKLIAGIIAIAFVIGFTFLLSPNRSYKSQSQKTLEQSIIKATVHCYAVEGVYPPSIEYLEDTYGVIVDHKRFYIDYNIFASNVMPSVKVYSREQED